MLQINKGTTNRKPFKDTMVAKWGVNILNGMLGGAVGGIATSAAQNENITKSTETQFGEFLGKYKGWIIAGAVTVLGALVIFFGSQIKKLFK
jgi:hypothetical protein